MATLAIVAFVVATAACVWWQQGGSQTPWTKRLKYEVSLQYTAQTQSQWYNMVLARLWLGALPLNEKGHLGALKQLGVETVVSVMEPFEKQRGWAWTPVDDAQWHEHDIQVVNVVAVDFEPLTHDALAAGVHALRKSLGANRTVYAHCKAGRGRSAAVVIAYLMLENGLSYGKAHDHVKRMRPEINVNAYQREAVRQYVASVRQASRRRCCGA